MATFASKTRAVFLFHGAAELRWVSKVPRHGVRVRSSQGKDWIVDEVVRSGVDTYTVTCVAPVNSRTCGSVRWPISDETGSS